MKNEIGNKYGRLTVIRRATEEEYPRGSGKHIMWYCKCDCGEYTFAQSSSLRNGEKVSCGCLNKEKAVELAKKLGEKNRFDLIGKKFGKLTVISLYKTGPENEKGITEWLCRCECGKNTVVRTSYLTSGHTTSCGCNRFTNKDGTMKTSKGEEKIIKILKENNIKFIREKTFEDLNKGNLRYDFYLPDRNIAIEYDGPQHFQQVEYFQKTRQDFLKAQERDRRKNNYALAHGIPLYRIPYWEMDELCGLPQIFDEKHLVKSMYHNDKLPKPKKL